MASKRSPDELIEFSHRLLHDLQIFFSVGRALVRRRVAFARPLPWDVETALIESFGLHARALTDFFFTKKQGRGDDDAFAFHFYDEPSCWLAAMPEQGPWLSQIRRRAESGGLRHVDRFGAQIAHLSFHRPPPSDYARGWPIMQVASEMGSALRAFLETVPPSNVGADFVGKAWREIPVIARLDEPYFAMAVWTRPEIRREIGGAA